MLAALEDSDLSVAAFAESRGLTPQRLYWWRNRLAQRSPSTLTDDNLDDGVDLVPVRVREAGGGPLGRSMEAIVIHLPSGATIEVPASKSPAWVAAFVRVLEEA